MTANARFLTQATQIPTHIRWEVVPPGVGEGSDPDLADTHCNICCDATAERSFLKRCILGDAPVLGHRKIDKNGYTAEITDRVHRTCLLRYREVNPSNHTACTICRIPYNVAEIPEIPITFAERTIDQITDMLSEGKKLGKRIAINLSTYATGGIFFSVCFFVAPIVEGLIKKGLSSLLGLATGSVLGACMGATALSLVGDVSLYAGRRIIEWTHVQNPTLRKVLFVFTAAIAAIASIYVAILLYSIIETHIVAQLAPQAQAAYSYLMGNADRCSGVSHAMWNTAVLANDWMFGVGIGNIAAFVTAFVVKQELFRSGADLDETIAVTE